MISKKNFEKEYIQEQIKKFPKVDPTKMEMTIFAFGLLDELIRCARLAIDINIKIASCVTLEAFFLSQKWKSVY